MALWVWMAALCVGQADARPGQVTATGAVLEKLADGFSFTEGPAANARGDVYFTDQPNDRIMVWSVDGKLSTFMQPSGRANGLCFGRDGRLWACADEKNELWVINVRTKEKSVVVAGDETGKRLNGPNDVWVAPGGRVYFTDPYYRRPYWPAGTERHDPQSVFMASSDGKRIVRVADDLKQPNGISGTPDGKTLYVADIGSGRTYAYDIAPDGLLTNRRIFCEMGSDGMTIDSEGNVYLTGPGVVVFDRTGKEVQRIAVPEERWTANVCFGGRDRRTLFITAGKGLYAIRMRTRGVGSQ
ncbi:MAG: SMP-30/gluconolactonase/LRE family protein [Chthonomonadales bacterium]|nr:SMP-30/gluconolactonase/LRE family protein [Chthonomonadales bacterium]